MSKIALTASLVLLALPSAAQAHGHRHHHHVHHVARHGVTSAYRVIATAPVEMPAPITPSVPTGDAHVGERYVEGEWTQQTAEEEEELDAEAARVEAAMTDAEAEEIDQAS